MRTAPVAGRSKATQQHTKAHNDSLVLSIIYDAGKISRAAVARHTALSRTSVGEVVAELLGDGLVEEIGRGRSTRGKSPILLSVKSDARELLGIDLSGEEFRGAVVNLRGEIQHRLSVQREGRSGQQALELVYVLIDELVSKVRAPLLGLGVGTPGLIDSQRGSQVHWAVNLDWLDLPLRELLEVRYGVPTYVLNDSHASVMAEYYFGRAGSTPNLIVIKCEEGLSAGIVLNGRLFRGDQFGAGEIGHVVFRENRVRCRCGNSGCLETLASGSAIIRRVRTDAAADPHSRLHAAAAGQQPFDLAAVLAAYEAGDLTVQRVVREAGQALGLAIAALVGTLNVRHILLAGSVTQLGQPLLEAVRQEVLARSLAALARETQVDYSAIGPDITALGAAAVLLHEELGIWPFRGTVPALSPRD